METTARIYAADASALEDSDLFAALYWRADARRRKKVDRLRQARDKRLSLSVAALLRVAFAELGVDPDEPIVETPYGKPFLPNRPDVRFNASHSGDQALCVVAGQEVGCDVEAIDSAEPDLAQRVLSDDELERFATVGDVEERRRLFCRYWTLKESFMKATGLGFSLDPKSFAIRMNAEGIIVKQRVDKNVYSFREYDLDDRYCRTCCVQNGSAPTELIFINLNNLTERN